MPTNQDNSTTNTTTTTPAPSDGVGIVKPPPTVTIPAPPAGFVPTNARDYRGFRPKKAELAAVPDAVLELQKFTDYEAVFGKTAPPSAHVEQAVEASAAWTALLSQSTHWDGYVKSMEGMAWKTTLALVDKLKGPFAMASGNDPTLLAKYPALARLLAVGKVIAKRASSTKKRNVKIVAAGGTVVPKKGSKAKHPAAPAQPAAHPAAHPAGGPAVQPAQPAGPAHVGVPTAGSGQ